MQWSFLLGLFQLRLPVLVWKFMIVIRGAELYAQKRIR